MAWRIVSCRALRPEEVSHGHTQGFCQPEKLKGGRVADASLDATHVAASKACHVSQSLLGKTLLRAQLADMGSQPLEGGVLGRLPSLAGHAAWLRSGIPSGHAR